MIDLSQWRASVGTFNTRQKKNLESATKQNESLRKAQPQSGPDSRKKLFLKNTQPASTTETTKAITVKCTATTTTHIEVGNTYCVTLLVGVHSNYILTRYF